MATYTRCLRCAGAPRRPASGSGLLLPFRPDMPSSLTPGSSTSPVQVAMPTWPSPRSERLGTPNIPAIRFTRGSLYEASPVRHCYGLSGCLLPLSGDLGDPHPRRRVLLAATPQRAPPQVSDVVAERPQASAVCWHPMVGEVAGDDLLQPAPWTGIG